MQQSFLGPPVLLVLAAAAAGIAALLVLWLLGRGLGGLVDRPRVPLPGTTYAAFIGLVVGLGTLAAIAYGLRGLYLDYANIGGPAKLGELRCEVAGGAGRVRVTFTPAAVGAQPESVEEEASSCRIELDLIRMRGFPSTGPIGLGSLARVAALGAKTRPTSAAPPQLAPDRPPLSLLVRRRELAVATTPPEASAAFDVLALPAGAPTGTTVPGPEAGGVRLEKRP
jgi:hypothetical protein